MDHFPLESSEIEIPPCSPSKYKALLFSEQHPVEQPEPKDFLRGLVFLADPAFYGVGLVQLSVVATHLLLRVPVSEWFRIRVAGNAPCIDSVRFFQIVTDALVLSQVPIRVRYHARIDALQPIIERPPHDAHERRVPETIAPCGVFRKRYRPLVVSRMTGAAQRYEIVRRIAARLAGFQMMDFKYPVL